MTSAGRSVAVAAVVLLAAACADEPAPPPDRNEVNGVNGISDEISVVADSLAVPWALAFLPSGEALITERDSARVLLRDGNGEISEVAVIDDVNNTGEGGLMGVAVSPEFPDTPHVFLYYTTDNDNRIERYTLSDGTLDQPETIVTGIPSARIHNGGALTFGPDGYLYAATGDAAQPLSAQDRESLGGKILRMTESGAPPSGNPFGRSLVWSYGHRNIQGLAFDSQNRLWASEFGANAWDELNLIEAGANYGWPHVEGIGGDDRFVDPVAVWRPADASPAGIAIVDDVVYMAALRGNRLWEMAIENGALGTPSASLHEYGRLRAVVEAPDGSLWVSTSNRDGRGSPAGEDDRILAVPLP